MNRPEISVIMSVYNEPKSWIQTSIESILKQTFSDFEFIIILDNPGYEGNMLVEQYSKTDNRIKIVYNDNNLGLTESLNKGLHMAQGKYIARMDADDISDRERFKKQYIYMEANLEVIVLGSYVDAFDEFGGHSISMDNCSSDKDINKIKMLFCNSGVAHSSAFIRYEFLLEHDIFYDENFKKSQDYALWSDIVTAGGIIYVYPEVLVKYRVHENQITKKNSSEQHECFKKIVKKQLVPLKMNLNEEKISMHFHIYNFDASTSVKKYDKYITELLLGNNKYHIYDGEKFENVIMAFWIQDIVKAVLRYHKFSFLLSRYFIQGLKFGSLKQVYNWNRAHLVYRKVLKQFLKKDIENGFSNTI